MLIVENNVLPTVGISESSSFSSHQRNPPMVVNDLFEDIKDGTVLISLLEVLSGQKLVIISP